MIKKICFISIVFLLITNCGFSPIYSSNKNQNINIEIIDYEGDTDINYTIRSRLMLHKNNENVKLFKIKINTKYEKNDLTKDAAGNIESYELKATSEFSIKRGDLTRKISITEKFTMENFSDDFEENNYEKKIKENFAVNIYQKLIIQILQIK